MSLPNKEVAKKVIQIISSKKKKRANFDISESDMLLVQKAMIAAVPDNYPRSFDGMRTYLHCLGLIGTELSKNEWDEFFNRAIIKVDEISANSCLS